jgi:CRISPR-associated protein (TIGR03986 family)
MTVHAPYNYVPLSQKVFFPEWASQVSQDIPFSDGISGEMVCTLEAKSPIYVRNGEKDDSSFFHVEKDEYLIPGSSIKGMLRNIIEIISFGKMGRVDDRQYSVRDLTKGASLIYGKKMTQNFEPLAKAAWLTQDANRQWHLAHCEYARVEQSTLTALNSAFGNELPKCKTSIDKYNAWKPQSLRVSFLGTGLIAQVTRHKMPLCYNYASSLNSGTLGDIVFTGQAGKKHMEFIFFDASHKKIIDVPPEIKKDFESVHSPDGKPNAEWAHWKGVLNNGTISSKVPVFYLEVKGKLHSIGLSQMYKLPYECTIHDAIRHVGKDHLLEGGKNMDLAETIFGFAGDPQGLKGRVWISTAVADPKTEQPDREYLTILNAPKPTYYPSYLEQPNIKTGYKTLMDKDATNSPSRNGCKVRGWKRYPARQFIPEKVTKPEKDQEKVSTRFLPLKAGAQFTFKIKVHNLKPEECGALLWALEWGGNSNLVHSIGMGKAYGFGQVKITIKEKCLEAVTDEAVPADVVKRFENIMDREANNEWLKTHQMQQLLAMANPDNKPQSGELRHMRISPQNEFIEAKKKNERISKDFERLEPYAIPTGIDDDTRFKEHKQRASGKKQEQKDKTLQAAAACASETKAEIWDSAKLT